MITSQDLYNIVSGKIANKMWKTTIRNIFPPSIAERMCDAIDANEKAEHFQRLMQEWMECQQRQQQIVHAFLQQCYYAKPVKC